MGISRLGLFALLALAAIGCRSKSADSDGGALVSGVASAIAGGVTFDSASGHVESTGATGAWRLDKASCFSGDNDGFYGVFVESKDDKRVWVKLVRDPVKGWNLGVSVPDTCKTGANGQQCEVEHFDAAACTKLDVGFKAYTFRGRSSNGLHQFDGTATFDCTRGTAHVFGTLTVEKCAQ